MSNIIKLLRKEATRIERAMNFMVSRSENVKNDLDAFEVIRMYNIVDSISDEKAKQQALLNVGRYIKQKKLARAKQENRRKEREARRAIQRPKNDVFKSLREAYKNLPENKKQELLEAIENNKTIQNILTIRSTNGIVWFTTNNVHATIFCDNTGSGSEDGSSWDDAMQYIDSAISAASAEAVWVKEGTCVATGGFPITLGGSGVPVYGGFDSALTGTNGSVEGRDLENDISIITGSDTTRCITPVANSLLDGFTIQNGYSGSGNSGGCFFLNTSFTKVDIDNCIIKNCSAASHGGVGYINGSGIFEFSNCEFDNNDSTGFGGCFITYLETRFYDCVFTDNSTTNSTGGNIMRQMSTGTTIFDGCTCTDNYGASSGYEFYGNAAATFTDTSFTSTTGTARALYVAGSGYDYTFDNVSFTGFTDRAIWFGTVDDIAFTDCTFTNCSYTGNGGVFGFGVLSSLSYTDCSFIGNHCTGSGSIWYYNSTVGMTATRCLFDTNYAGNSGGIGYISGTGGSALNFVACIVCENYTTGSGNGSFLHLPPVTRTVNIEQCTIEGNDAAGTACVYASSSDQTINVRNSIVYGNTDGGSDDQFYGGTRTVTYSDIEGGHTGSGNINVDPNFVGTGDPDAYYELANWSSGDTPIDAADYSYWPSGGDYKGRSIYDDTGVTNTGTGTYTYTDMGALEKQTNSGAAPMYAALQLGCNF